jgi:hypothetical protein
MRPIVVLLTTATGAIISTMITYQLIMMGGALTTAEDGTTSGIATRTGTITSINRLK